MTRLRRVPLSFAPQFGAKRYHTRELAERVRKTYSLPSIGCLVSLTIPTSQFACLRPRSLRKSVITLRVSFARIAWFAWSPDTKKPTRGAEAQRVGRRPLARQCTVTVGRGGPLSQLKLGTESRPALRVSPVQTGCSTEKDKENPCGDVRGFFGVQPKALHPSEGFPILCAAANRDGKQHGSDSSQYPFEFDARASCTE